MGEDLHGTTQGCGLMVRVLVLHLERSGSSIHCVAWDWWAHNEDPFFIHKKKKKEKNPVLNWFYFSFTGLPWVTRVTLIFVMQQFSQPLSFNPTPNTANTSLSQITTLSLSLIYTLTRERAPNLIVFLFYFWTKKQKPQRPLYPASIFSLAILSPP